jgi:hypothetical protein
MQFLIALAAAVVVGFLLWKLMVRQPGDPGRAETTRRVTAPDDDPEFLRRLGEQMGRSGDDPPGRA